MNPVTRAMERLGWSWQPVLGLYMQASGGLGIKYKDAEMEFNKGNLAEFVKESIKQYRRDLKRKKNEKI